MTALCRGRAAAACALRRIAGRRRRSVAARDAPHPPLMGWRRAANRLSSRHNARFKGSEAMTQNPPPPAAPPPVGDVVDYRDIRADLRTGDLLLFGGRTWFSHLVEAFSDSPWSHVGMVMRLPQYDFVCLYEATALHDLQDLDTQTVHDGVQLVPLSQRVRSYHGDISYRKLHGFELNDTHHHQLLKLRHTFRGRPWEKNNLELIRAMWASIVGPSRHGRVDLSSFFCSELVSKCYQTLGLLDSGPQARPCDEYVPADFSSARLTQLNCGARLGPEVLLKRLSD
jgi:hypothetical protein